MTYPLVHPHLKAWVLESPDSSKLTAVVKWKIPEDVLHLEGFLGLTAYFRDLVKGYAALEKPLHDLLRTVDIPNGTRKAAYQRIMKAYKLQLHWTEEHTATFVALKAWLVSEPMLTAPRFDRTHFILTTDACKDAFAGVLSQKIKTTLPGGKEVTQLHPSERLYLKKSTNHSSSNSRRSSIHSINSWTLFMGTW